MKKIIFKLNIKTGEFAINAVGFKGNECDRVLKDIETEIEEKQVIRKTEQSVEQKQEATIEIFY